MGRRNRVALLPLIKTHVLGCRLSTQSKLLFVTTGGMSRLMLFVTVCVILAVRIAVLGLPTAIGQLWRNVILVRVLKVVVMPAVTWLTFCLSRICMLGLSACVAFPSCIDRGRTPQVASLALMM